MGVTFPRQLSVDRRVTPSSSSSLSLSPSPCTSLSFFLFPAHSTFVTFVVAGRDCLFPCKNNITFHLTLITPYTKNIRTSSIRAFVAFFLSFPLTSTKLHLSVLFQAVDEERARLTSSLHSILMLYTSFFGAHFPPAHSESDQGQRLLAIVLQVAFYCIPSLVHGALRIIAGFAYAVFAPS